MYNWNINEEHRIAFSFSKSAFVVIEQDMLDFRINKMSTFVCHVFENYYETAEASIGRTLERKKKKYMATLCDLPEQVSSSVVDVLIEQDRRELVERHTEHIKGERTRVLRLRNSTYKKICQCMQTEPKYYRSISSYMSAVVEEYCSLPHVERERIYYKERFDLIRDAAEKRKRLRVTIQDGRQFIVYPQYKEGTNAAEKCDQSDCACIETDRLNTASYLVGYSRYPEQKKNEKIPASFRITSLAEIEGEEETYILSKQDRDHLVQSIKKRGVEFLLHEPIEVRVRLTPRGEYKLSRISHLRPREIGQEGDVHIFQCTQMQAEFYFIRMGADCEILAPEALRSSFAEMYSAVEKIYHK